MNVRALFFWRLVLKKVDFRINSIKEKKKEIKMRIQINQRSRHHHRWGRYDRKKMNLEIFREPYSIHYGEDLLKLLNKLLVNILLKNYYRVYFSSSL